MTPPRLPRSVLILGQRFSVKAVVNLMTHTGEAVEPVSGLCDSDAQIIQIETVQGKDRFAETFVHEQLHAMVALAGLRHSFHDDDLTEEDLVKRLAPIMLDWLRRNPNVYTFLTGRYTYR